MNRQVVDLFAAQEAAWPAMRDNYASLGGVRVRSLDVHGVPYRVQWNPARLVSSAARTDAVSVAARPCFLCAPQRPPEQTSIPFAERYDILVNPFPIFPRHLTIAATSHTEQRIADRIDDLLALADALDDFVVFYNGPRCGASAPDHAHFQAGSRGLLPIEAGWRSQITGPIARCGDAMLWCFDESVRRAWVIEAPGAAGDAAELFRAVYRSLPCEIGSDEPMLNVLAWRDAGVRVVVIFPRARHRPACYPSLLSSPASVDLGGVFILPQRKDFEAIDVDDVAQILDEVCLPRDEYRHTCIRIPLNLGAVTGEAR